MAWSYHAHWGIGFYPGLAFSIDDWIKINVMKTKECPSCAMDVDSKSKICPICQYEFAEIATGYKWIAIMLTVIMLLYLFF